MPRARSAVVRTADGSARRSGVSERRQPSPDPGPRDRQFLGQGCGEGSEPPPRWCPGSPVAKRLYEPVADVADVFGEQDSAKLGLTPGRIVEPALPGRYRITEAGWDTAAGLFVFAGETERAAWAVG